MNDTQYIEIDKDGKKRYYSDRKMTILHRLDGPAIEWANGNKAWYVNGKLHREDGPAVEYANGTKEWYVNGKRHRLDGPAIEWANGYKEWNVNGKRHRLDGPAVEGTNGTKEWYVNGKRHRYCAPAIEYADGAKEWLVNGVYHRLDGPAIECANGEEAWCINGESISEDEFFKRTDWREDQHIVVLRYLRDVLSVDIETASELLKTNLIKIIISIIDEMHDEAMKEKRANGFIG